MLGYSNGILCYNENLRIVSDDDVPNPKDKQSAKKTRTISSIYHIKSLSTLLETISSLIEQEFNVKIYISYTKVFCKLTIRNHEKKKMIYNRLKWNVRHWFECNKRH